VSSRTGGHERGDWTGDEEPEVAMTKDEVVAVLAWCDNPWCGELFDPRDGWGGRCPSCLALADEHGSGRHAVVIEACVECRREPRTGTRRSA
jgi:hypothetical protein